MNKEQIEKIKNFFNMKRNKDRLLELIKKGEYIEFEEKIGFIYAVKIGEAEDMDVMLKVSMLNGQFTILDSYFRIIPGVEMAIA
ncbi:hypothetical protein [Viridibacillus arvi]|uniref:hypothetical protein n=1 Tax=Viridibacillus arvi TaxID=263475 RepID=UPI0034CF6AFF